MAKIKCYIKNITLDGDYGEVDSVCATCSKCDHQVESYGDGESSINRCLALMNEECPLKENNFYIE